jgi:hypothetical protein
MDRAGDENDSPPPPWGARPPGAGPEAHWPHLAPQLALPPPPLPPPPPPPPPRRALRLTLPEWDLPPGIVAAYEARGVRQLFPWQAAAIECGQDGGNLVYTAPTSGGKSLVADVLMIRRLLATAEWVPGRDGARRKPVRAPPPPPPRRCFSPPLLLAARRGLTLPRSPPPPPPPPPAALPQGPGGPSLRVHRVREGGAPGGGAQARGRRGARLLGRRGVGPAAGAARRGGGGVHHGEGKRLPQPAGAGGAAG